MSPESPQHKAAPRSWLHVLGWCNLALPLLALLVIAVRTSVNIPIEDDYGAVGEFLERYVSLHGFMARAWWVLTAQFVQYKLMFLHTVVALEYQITGHENLRTLELLGDLALPAVLVVLWFLLARSGRPLSQRVWLFSFPCYLYLSLCYIQTLNWAMSGLQNMAILPFSLAAIFFFTAAWRGSFALGVAFLVIAIGTSGNGFFAAVVCLFVLLRSRRYAAASLVAVASLLMALLYAWHYQVYMVGSPLPLGAAVKSIAAFPFVFLGAPAGSHYLAALVGLGLVIGFVMLTRRGWAQVCPGSFAAALFCLVTAAGVTITRYRGHAVSAVQGRYMMYGLLLLALEYIAALRLYAPSNFEKNSRWTGALLAASLAAAVFCVSSDVRAYRELHYRKQVLITHLILWQRHPDHLVVLPDEGSDRQTPVWIKHRREAQRDLQIERAMGLYIPPFSAHDPLPVRTHSPATIGIENEHW
jgi:hypothetical protein